MPTTTTLTEGQVRLINSLAAEWVQHRNDLEAGMTAESVARLWQDCAATSGLGVHSYIDALIASVRTERNERASRDSQRLAATQPPAEVVAEAQALEAIPDGHYAVPGADGDLQPLRFYRIRQPRGARTSGTQYVYRMESDNARYMGAIRNGQASAGSYRNRVNNILAAIREQGIQASAQRYGVEIGRCFVCNRQLTDATSRALGIGPDCRGARSRHAAWAGRDYSTVTRTSATPLSTPDEPQTCTTCGDVAVGLARPAGSSTGQPFCDECAIDSDSNFIRYFAPSIRRRSAAVA